MDVEKLVVSLNEKVAGKNMVPRSRLSKFQLILIFENFKLRKKVKRDKWIIIPFSSYIHDSVVDVTWVDNILSLSEEEEFVLGTSKELGEFQAGSYHPEYFMQDLEGNISTTRSTIIG